MNKPFITDNGNYILDLHLEVIKNPKKLEKSLLELAGVLDCGIFFEMADIVVFATEKGIDVIENKRA